MKSEIKNKIKSIPKFAWILLLIVLFGTFLRSYNFHDWLYFSADQVRDATLVENVVKGESAWPLLGASMRKSGTSKSDLFYLGPIYYYFQITAAKIFGPGPDKMAYPDLLFSILSIPLFFFFLKRYFNINLSLVLTGLYSISFFSIHYSRFAWNPNIIPFFILLFLLSFYEFLIEKEKVHWVWIILIGISLGIGVQLHMMLLILLPIASIILFVFLAGKNKKIWLKCLVIVLIAVIFNFSQIISEKRTNFTNAKAFLSSVSGTQQSGKKDGLISKILNTSDCQIEANAYILTAYGENVCDFSYVRLVKTEKSKKFLNKINDPKFALIILASFIFSIFGYVFLVHFFWKEKNLKKKYFLGLILFFGSLAFLLMVPIISSGLNEFRYFIHLFFIPYIFLGILFIVLKKKYPSNALIAMSIIFILLVIANFSAIHSVTKELLHKEGSGAHSAYLGEIEPIAEYILSNSGNQNEGYLIGSFMYVANLSRPLAYLTKKQNFNLIRGEGLSEAIPTGKPLFYVMKAEDNFDNEIRGHKVINYEKFGRIIIFTLEN